MTAMRQTPWVPPSNGPTKHMAELEARLERMQAVIGGVRICVSCKHRVSGHLPNETCEAFRYDEDGFAHRCQCVALQRPTP